MAITRESDKLNRKTTDAEAAGSIPKAAAAPAKWFVVDTTAVPSAENPTGKRVHDQLVGGQPKQFAFEPHKGTEMAPEIAAKFLQHDGFKRVDADGNEVAYERPPRQPEQLQAGEQIVIGRDETVARLDELTNQALWRRVMTIPGGEKFAANPNRPAVIAFIVEHKAKVAAANRSKERDIKSDEFVPTADYDEEEAA